MTRVSNHPIRMFETVLERLPELALAAGEALPYRASNFVSGLESMPVRFTPTPRSTPSVRQDASA